MIFALFLFENNLQIEMKMTEFIRNRNPHLNNLRITSIHYFISNGTPINLCEEGSVLATTITFKLLSKNKNSDTWEIIESLAKHDCYAMGSSGIDKTYPIIEKKNTGIGYQSGSEKLLKILNNYKIDKMYIQMIIEDLIFQESQHIDRNTVLNAGPMPLEFWEKLHKQNNPISLEHLSWIKLEIEKFKKSFEK